MQTRELWKSQLSQNGASKPSAPVGVLILGRKRPGFDQEWNRSICSRTLAAMEQMGFRTIGFDMPVVDDATLAVALKEIKARGCDVIMMLQPSIGNGQLSLTLAQQWPGPIVLWATPERPGDGRVSSCSLVGQHLWASNLRQARHPFELVYGDPDSDAVRSDLMRAIRLARTTAVLQQAKIGMIGGHAPGFIDFAVDPFLLRQSFGIQLHALSLFQFVDRAKAVDEQRLNEDVLEVKKMGLPLLDVEERDLAVQSRCYLAMRDLMEEESLQALSIQCWPELPEVLQWPYLAISRLTTEGRAVSMEGDVDGAIAEWMGISLDLGPGFLTDWLEHDQSSIFLWHPGMAPLTMCYAAGETNGPVLARHFNITKPLVVDAPLQTDQPATVMRLWHCDSQYFMTAVEGQTVRPRRNLTGNTVLFETDKNVSEYFDKLIHAGMPHHVLLFYAHCGEAFRRLARMMQMNWVA
jgi:L-fucose isomerase-like protein